MDLFLEPSLANHIVIKIILYQLKKLKIVVKFYLFCLNFFMWLFYFFILFDEFFVFKLWPFCLSEYLKNLLFLLLLKCSLF